MKEESKKDAKDEKMPLLFLSEIAKTLDTGSIMIFKEAIKKLKTGQLSGIDVFANDVRVTYLFSWCMYRY